MIAVFRKGKAVIEAHDFFGEIVKPETTATSGRWSFYTVLHFPSSNCARGHLVRLRLNSFGRDTAANVGSWGGMGSGCVSKGMVVIAVRSGACEQAGW